MRALSTSDVPLQALHDLAEFLRPEIALQVDTGQIFFKAVDPPSWVVFFADAPWWVQTFGPYAALYVAEIVKEAAKDTWKARIKIINGAIVAGNQVKRLAIALWNAKSHMASRTRIDLGVPIPDDYDGTRFELIGSDVNDFAVQIALYIHHLPALLELIEREQLNRARVAVGMHLRLLPDASLEVCWQDNDLLTRHRRTIPLNGDDAL